MGEYVIPLRRNLTAEALMLGAGLGIVAQILRQLPGDSMQLGAATAPWLSIGFAFAVWSARGRVPGRVLATYLLAWLVAYHLLFALGQSVSYAAAMREALPWLVLTLPVCLVLSPVATLARRPGFVGDACLSAAIAWSLPEMIENAGRGDELAAASIAAMALLPFAATGRRDVRLAAVVVAVIAFGTVALIAGPLVRSYIHS